MLALSRKDEVKDTSEILKETYEKLSFSQVELIEEETISLACWRSTPSSC